MLKVSESNFTGKVIFNIFQSICNVFDVIHEQIVTHKQKKVLIIFAILLKVESD